MTEYVNLKKPIEFAFKVVCYVTGLDAPACGITEISDFLNPTPASINVPTLLFGIVAGIGSAYAGYRLVQCYKTRCTTNKNTSSTQSAAAQSLRDETTQQQLEQQLLDIDDDPTPPAANSQLLNDTDATEFHTARNSTIAPTSSRSIYDHDSLTEAHVVTPVKVKVARLMDRFRIRL